VLARPNAELHARPNTADGMDKASEAPKGQKRNPPAMFASHCPFCGVAIEDEKVMDASAPNDQAQRPLADSDAGRSQ